MLQSYALHDYASVPFALGLSGKERIVDAGGGLGALGRLIISEYPGTRVTVLDRPEVVEQATRIHPQLASLVFHSANMFDDWEMNADVVVLSRVLHDWEDDAAVIILARARAALPVGGRVFVIEMLRPERSASGALCDLHLLVATGGRERSAGEFKRLFEQTRFHLQEVRTIAALPSILVGLAQ